MIPNTYDYHKPSSLQELFQLMEQGNPLLLAGGTDVILKLREERAAPDMVIDIKGIDELHGIGEHDGQLFIGAAVPIQDVVEHPFVQPYGALVMGCGSIGCYEIRHRATIGGNVCNGSPSADSAPGLLVHDAQVVLVRKEGKRTLPLCDFLLGPGKVALKPGEIMSGVLLPSLKDNAKSLYYRRSRVKGMDLSGLSVAVYCEGMSEFRIALGAVWPTVARALQAEAALNSSPFSHELLKKAIGLILADVSPRKGSLRATPEYKKDMIPVLIEKGYAELLGGVFA